MEKITLRQLEILAAVAEHGSFSAASKAIHLTQPAVSMQIKQLEGAMEVPIFEHMGKKIHLTEPGHAILQFAELVEHELTNLKQAIANMQGLKGGSLTISVASTVNAFAARMLAHFSQRHPDVRINLNVVNRSKLLEHLADNRIDLALMGQPPRGRNLKATAFLDNPLVVIAACGHPLARLRKVRMQQLLDEPLIGRERGSGTREAIEKHFNDQGLDFGAAMEMNKNEAIKHAVEAGLGLGIVSLHTIKAELAAGQLQVLKVEGFPLVRQWYLVQRANKRLAPAAFAFAQMVIKEADQIDELLAPPTEA